MPFPGGKYQVWKDASTSVGAVASDPAEAFVDLPRAEIDYTYSFNITAWT